MRLDLTDKEKAIFRTILAVDATFHLGAIYRVAGGYVRDRILGLQSDDLDIALDNMTGRQFEVHLRRFAKADPACGIGKSYIVEETPGVKLETVAVEICGRKIDFINLRSETYGDTRVPEMRFGDPKTDAERRDLTVNALFYNINTGEVEDHVGGLEDIRTMTLRTPLNPLRTLTDDPLRALRALRFLSRFKGARMDKALERAIADPSVHEAYRKKVAPERAGPEILKMLAGAAPAEALRIMFSAGLHKAVFDLPETNELMDLWMDQRNSHHKHNLMEHTLFVVQNMCEILSEEKAPEGLRVRMLLAALFHDFGKAHPDICKPKKSDPEQRSYHGHEEKSAVIAEAALLSIGVPEADRKFVTKVISLHMRPHQSEKEWTGRAVGRFLRDTQIPGQDSSDVWRWVFLLGIADTRAKDMRNQDLQDVEQKKRVMDVIGGAKLRSGDLMTKPLLNGHDLMAMFPSLAPSSGFIKDLTARLLEEQSAGNVNNRDEAAAFIETSRAKTEAAFGTERHEHQEGGRSTGAGRGPAQEDPEDHLLRRHEVRQHARLADDDAAGPRRGGHEDTCPPSHQTRLRHGDHPGLPRRDGLAAPRDERQDGRA